MEEARQHPALTLDQLAYLVLLFGGVLALLGGLVLQFAARVDAIGIAALTFIGTRFAMALLRVVRPAAIVEQRPGRTSSVAELLLWSAIGIVAAAIALG